MDGDLELVDHITTYSELVLALVGVLSALWIGMKKLYRMARNIETLVEHSKVNANRLHHIEQQMKLNGGSSLRDAVHRIEKTNEMLNERLAAIEHLPCHLHAVAEQLDKEQKE